MIDFQIADQGSIISIKPVSEAARTWVDENVESEPWQRLGDALCVDLQCARDLLDAIATQGFENVALIAPHRNTPRVHRSSGVEMHSS